jgi:uncharacterized membrane protein (DUF106 family)
MVIDAIFNPLLSLPIWLSILIVSLVVSLILSLLQKYTTNQKLMKELKDDLGKLQKEAKELSKKNPKKALSVQTKILEKNNKYMMQSFKPMFFSMIPILIIFGWLSANYSYIGITENSDFSITVLMSEFTNINDITLHSDDLTLISNETNVEKKSFLLIPYYESSAKFTFKGAEPGVYPVKINYQDEEYLLEVTITENGDTVGQTSVTKRGSILGIKFGSTNGMISDKSDISMVKVDVEKLKPFGDDFNIFGYFPGFLFTYIIYSIVFSMLIRKFLKVY